MSLFRSTLRSQARRRASASIALPLVLALSGCGEDVEEECNCVGPDASVDAGIPDAGPADATLDAEIDGGEVDAGYAWNLPRNFPTPSVPEDNPMTAEKVELGRHLFYDKNLSDNRTQSCASCHDQKLAFSDGLGIAVGSTDVLHPRGSMSLTNVVYQSTFTWANPLMVELERQAQVPLFGDDPVEMGLTSQEQLVARLRERAAYESLFPAAFPDDEDPFTTANALRAIASFERTLISGNSAFDRYNNGDPTALSESAKRGEQLFNSEGFECFHCHGGFNFSDQLNHANQRVTEAPFHNNALYNIDGMGSYPPANQGIITFTGNPIDMGKFKAPTLRNIAVTAPYMHDGSIATLNEVIDHYAAGGRRITEGPFAGNGFDSRFKSEFLLGFVPTEKERADLIAFLESLTDEEFLTNPAHADPWPVE